MSLLNTEPHKNQFFFLFETEFCLIFVLSPHSLFHSLTPQMVIHTLLNLVHTLWICTFNFTLKSEPPSVSPNISGIFPGSKFFFVLFIIWIVLNSTRSMSLTVLDVKLVDWCVHQNQHYEQFLMHSTIIQWKVYVTAALN